MWIFSTGEFQIGEFPLTDCHEKISTIQPAELLLDTGQETRLLEHLSYDESTQTWRESWSFQYDYAMELLTRHFGTISLKGFGVEELHNGIRAAGAIMVYLRENQKERLTHMTGLSRMSDSNNMLIDSTTRRNLELIQPMNSRDPRATLLSVVDQTRTSMGARMMMNWLLYPLNSAEPIEQRLNAVEEFFQEKSGREALRDLLQQVGDLERLLAKFATGRANARDANTIASTLHAAEQIKELLSTVKARMLLDNSQRIDPLNAIRDEIDRGIVETPPISTTDGGMFRPGYHDELDELCIITHSGKDWIARLQKTEREKTGIPSLKVNYNKVFGYYIEVTKPNLSKVPEHYIRKQTLVNAERYITQELKEYEEKILGAEEKIAALEYDLFIALRDRLLAQARPLQNNAKYLARIDCLASLAQTAVDNNYTRPGINTTRQIVIKEGRHPVVEKLLPAGEPFVVNDTLIDNQSDQILIITGPNMAGKSTYLRQVGLLTILAQMGSFIPAAEAQIGLVDRVFTRVGASDNLAAGESTFLTEMNETANILNNATPKSLVLLDEIGRGTSTYDGLSLAWSVAEYLHQNKKVAAKTIFATHYHELTELERILPRVKNYNVAVREWADHIVFLRKIVPGGCDHSHGIHVAELAGLPRAVIERAKQVLANLEAAETDKDNVPKLALYHKKAPDVQQLSLFEEQEKKLRKEIEQINPDEITPIEALKKLDQLKQLTVESH
ncbi:MAG: DNA mismatch repair protein MutS [candidate division KSB1 bacterium]|nr:DNA mismatch repair protein MutS [candidate division KSB1 bacterium]